MPVLAVDMDDTLLRSDGTISEFTLEVVANWRTAGNPVVIATGRPPRSIALSLPPDLHSIPWISYNGARISNGGDLVYENFLPVELARRTLEVLLKYLPDTPIGVEIDDILYLNRPSTRPSRFEIANLLEITNRPTAKILFYHEDFAQLSPLLEELPTDAKVLLSQKYGLVQIMAHDADKAVALAHLVTGWGYSMADVVAFGDDVNDVDMVRSAGLGVAVANAVEEVKAVADRVTLTNDEDGVAIVIAELLDYAKA
jgi:5-amino-6-(5-phospho-D-ribitylamino)uracil phosphatase